MGRGRLGSTRPSAYVTGGSGTTQASGSLSSLSRKTKHVELEWNPGNLDLNLDSHLTLNCIL